MIPRTVIDGGRNRSSVSRSMLLISVVVHIGSLDYAARGSRSFSYGTMTLVQSKRNVDSMGCVGLSKTKDSFETLSG